MIKIQITENFFACPKSVIIGNSGEIGSRKIYFDYFCSTGGAGEDYTGLGAVAGAASGRGHQPQGGQVLSEGGLWPAGDQFVLQVSAEGIKNGTERGLTLSVFYRIWSLSQGIYSITS